MIYRVAADVDVVIWWGSRRPPASYPSTQPGPNSPHSVTRPRYFPHAAVARGAATHGPIDATYLVRNTSTYMLSTPFDLRDTFMCTCEIGRLAVSDDLSKFINDRGRR